VKQIMQLLISAIITLALGTGAFFSLNQHPNSIIGSANGQGKETAKMQLINQLAEITPLPIPTNTPSPMPIISPKPTTIIKTNNGLHLGIIKGKHLGEGKEELHENENAEEHENEHSTPTGTPAALLQNKTELHARNENRLHVEED
jgi:hypothetical protein